MEETSYKSLFGQLPDSIEHIRHIRGKCLVEKKKVSFFNSLI